MDGRQNGSTPFFSSTSTATHRFLVHFDQPDPNPDPDPDSHPSHPLELDEHDVVWSSDSHPPPPPPIQPPLAPPSSLSPYSAHLLRHHPRFNSSNSGLSAALTDDQLQPLVRRKSILNPSHSASKAIPSLNSAAGHPKSNAGIKFPQSAPMNVPAWPRKFGEIIKDGWGHSERFDEVDDEVEEEEEMVPPHVIVARSHVTFSVFEGVGRTLKGRDLRRVRNAVFQKTGFID